MRLCHITKYPPIEGGTASEAYWLAKGLGKKGYKIDIITNAWEAEEGVIEVLKGEDLKLLSPKNVNFYSTDPNEKLGFVPYTNPYAEKLANLALDYDFDIIDSRYILPYAISGFIVKQIKNRPLVIRHAGSDITRLYESPSLNNLFKEVLKRADMIVTSSGLKKRFESMGVKVFTTKVCVDTSEFNPHVKEFEFNFDCPLITYFGKIHVTKGIYDLTKAISKIKEDYRLLFVTGGEDIELLKQEVKRLKIEDKTIFMSFVPCWKVPSIIKASRCVVMPERDFSVSLHMPILPREVWSVGKCSIFSEELFSKFKYYGLINEESTISVNPKDTNEFLEKLKKVIKDRDYADYIGKNARKLAKKNEDFEKYLEDNERLYKELK